MWRAVLVLAVAGVLVVAPAQARACDCPEPDPPEAAAEAAAAVFAGEVVEVGPEAPRPDEDVVAVVDVAEVYAGEVGQRVEVATPADQGLCGIEPEEGEELLVYAHADDEGRLGTDLCTRTTSLDRAEDDLAALGEPRPPEPLGEDSGDGGALGWALALLAAAVVAGAAAAWRLGGAGRR